MAIITADLTATFGALTLSGSGAVVKVANLSVTLGSLTLVSEATRQPFIVRGASGRGRRIARNLRLQTALDVGPAYRSRAAKRPSIFTERRRSERSIRKRDRRQLDTTLNARMFAAIDPVTVGEGAGAYITEGSPDTLIIFGTSSEYYYLPGYGP